MLASSDLADGLSHTDPAARDQALLSLSMAGVRSGVAADVALRAVDEFGPEAFARPLAIRQLLASPELLRRLIGCYERSRNPQVGEWIADFPQSLLNSEPALRVLAPSELKTAIERRLALGQQPAESLWRELAGGISLPLILALVEHEQFTTEKVLRTLAKQGDALEMAAIELAGRLHLGMALNQLLDRFTGPAEMAAAAVIAVARIGTAGAVTAIEQRCDHDPAVFRGRAAECLARIRVPSVEAALFRLLVEEEEPAIVCQFARALLCISTSTSFDRICDMVRSGKCTDADLKPQLAGLSILLKKPVAETDAWRGRREVTDRAFAAAVRVSSVPANDSLPSVHLDAETDDSLEPADQPPAAAVAPIRRDDARVGRNDPCPCGSGRKYKKCCGA